MEGGSALIPIVLFVVFFALYSLLSYRIVYSTVYSEHNDILFQLDHIRGIRDIAIFSAAHKRTHVHPIYVLLVNPIGSGLAHLVPQKTAAILLNALIGAASVGLAFVFFKIFNRNALNALLLSVIFGFSMSQLVFGAIPETASLSICSLILTYTLFLVSLRTATADLRYWIPVGILSLGATITNFTQTAICFAVVVCVHAGCERKIFKLVRRVGVYIGAVLALTALAALAQKAIYPTSTLFFDVTTMTREVAGTAGQRIFEDPMLVVGLLAKHFFLVNLAAPLPFSYFLPGKELPSITFAITWDYLVVGWVAAGMGVAFICKGISKGLFSNGCNRPFFIGILLCVLFNMALHSIYYMRDQQVLELFLYTGNFTFLVLMFAGNFSGSSSRTLTVLLSIWAILLGINNALVMNVILAHYPICR